MDAMAQAEPRPALARKFDPQSVRVAILLLVVALLNMIDLIFTLFAHRAGLLREMNPIAASFFHMDLEQSVICFKALAVLTGSWMLWRLRRSPWTAGACWVLVAVYTVLGAMWFVWSQDYQEIMELRAGMGRTVLVQGQGY